MNVLQIIPTTGAWYVMMRNQDSPETCHARPIAAWARISVEDSDPEVVPLIANDDYGFTNKLVTPSAEDVVGICDQAGVADPNWQDIARESQEAEQAAIDREEATDERAKKAINKLVETPTHPRCEIIPAKKQYELLTAVSERLRFLYDPMVMHALDEAELIEAHPGHYRLTALGHKALKLLSVTFNE